MKIVLVDYSSMYLLILLLILSFIRKSNILHSCTEDEYLSKDITDSLKGLSVIIVVFHHISLFSVKQGIFKYLFVNAGFLAVSVFLFVSGYGLMTQFKLKKNYLKNFILNKVLRLYLIFFISNIIVTILNNIFLQTNYNVKNILMSSVLMNFSNGRELWFVGIILFFYIAFYISFKFFNNKSILMLLGLSIIYIILCRFINKGTWWYNTAFCFIIGVLISLNKSKVFNFIKNRYASNLILSVILFVSSMLLYTKGYSNLQFIIPIIFIYFICTLLVKVQLKSKSMEYINKISFEMYLIHLIVLQIAFKDDITRNSIYLVALFPIMIVLSIITKWICDTLFKGIKRILD